jgi:putative ABC transport system permease protein
MTDERLLALSVRWFGLLLRLYPIDFRDEMGSAIVTVYRDRAVEALRRRGRPGVLVVWMRAFVDAAWNGLAEHLRPAAMWRRAGGWGRDLTLARRRIVREPVFVVVTIATLTVGLGAFAVVYTAVDKILIEPLPYREPENLYLVWRDESANSGLPRDWLSGPDVAELQRAGGVIEAAAGIQLFWPTLSASTDGEPMQIALASGTNNLFDLLGVAPALGRTFTENEIGPNFSPVVILSHAMWTRLGADPALVGRDVWMSGSPYAVIGVLPNMFRFGRHAPIGPPIEADVYVPLRAKPADQNPNATSYGTLVRVKDGTSPEQALAAVEAAGRAVHERFKQNRPFRLYTVGLHDDLVARVKPVLIALGLTGAFLLLVLAVNLASLLLARAAARERELAVSRAVGGNGAAIVRSMLAEGLFLGVAGGIAGAVAGHWGTKALVALAPDDLPRLHALALDWQAGAVVVGVGGLLGVMAAVVPAAWASRISLASLLAAMSVRGGGSVTPLRRVMIVTQIAVSLVLLSAGALVVRSFERLLAAEPGFRSDGVLTFTVAMGPRLFPQPEQVMLFEDRLEAALRDVPGVIDASATTALPLSGQAAQFTITMPGAPGNTGNQEHDAPTIDLIQTRASYHALMGITLVAGRGFETARREGVKEALIDARLASQFFSTRSALGSSLVMNAQTMTIVGVVIPARVYDLHEDGRPQIYVRAEDWTPYTPSFVIRTAGDPRALAADMPRIVRQVDPRIPISGVKTMDEIVEAAMRQPRISAVLIAGFAVGALLLVAMGLFGMVAGAVSQRRSELAVRLALGATHYRVLRLVMGEGALLVAVGMMIAVPGVYAAGRFIRGVLIGVSPLDPASLLAAAGGLALVTLVACYVPARRVLGINPSPLLRQ